MDVGNIYAQLEAIQKQLDTNQISYLHLAISISIIVLSNYFLVYYFSYSKKKGENVATKSDIDIITDKIESVKSEYSKQIEIFKKEIDHKYESYKLVSDTKVELYKKSSLIRQAIDNRIHNIGNEDEQLAIIFSGTPSLIIELNSFGFLRADKKLQEAILKCTEEQNILAQELQAVKDDPTRSNIHTVDYGKLRDSIDHLQSSIIGYTPEDSSNV